MIISAIPLSVIGVAFGLFITGKALSIMSFIGIIILVGIVVNDSIVKIDTIERLRKIEKMELREAIVETGKRRFRPILMTSITTIVGLIPLSMGIGAGSELSQPMGITVVFGLLSSTLLTLYVVPIIYYILERKENMKNNKDLG